jgi:uncharacterized protein (TIGR02118 family)
MIKLTFAVRRRDDVDEAEFHRYWRDEHGPLVRSFQDALGIRRYVQVHRIDTPFNDALRASRDALEPFDGVAELWWDDLDALAAGSSSPDGVDAGRALLEDERRFIDLERSALWLNEEVEVIPAVES